MLGRRTLSSGMFSRRYQLEIFSGTMYSVVLVRTDVSKIISPPYSEFFMVTVIRRCVMVESLLKLHRRQVFFDFTCIKTLAKPSENTYGTLASVATTLQS
jgi:hypothetical protein